MPQTVAELLADLTEQGFTVSVRGDNLAVAPAARVSPALRSELTRHKSELLRLLRKTDEPRESATPFRAEAAQEPRSAKGDSPPVPDPLANLQRALNALTDGSVCGCARCHDENETARRDRRGEIDWRRGF